MNMIFKCYLYKKKKLLTKGKREIPRSRTGLRRLAEDMF